MWGVVDTHLSLEEYWETLQIVECAGYGIRGAPNHITGMGCGDFWNQENRYWLAFAIAKVENRLSTRRWMGFPVRRQCYVDKQLEYLEPLILPHNYIRQIGPCTPDLLATEDLDLGVEADPTDPVTFTIAVAFDDPDELVLYYSGQTRYTIRPSSVVISGGIATVQIPRCRLLSRDYFINYSKADDATRPPYSGVGSNAYFEDDVDVYRVYVDTTQGATAVWFPNQTCRPGALSRLACAGSSQTVCVYIQNQADGVVQTTPAAYDVTTGYWNRQSWVICTAQPNQIVIDYMAGRWDRYEAIEEDLIRAIIALAHNNLPKEFCSCAVQQRYYKDDTKPIEPAVNFGLGPSTWGTKEASEIVSEYRLPRGGFMG